ncbi:hypothetical protein ACFLSE_03010 [Bacteroidota bacterium]
MKIKEIIRDKIQEYLESVAKIKSTRYAYIPLTPFLIPLFIVFFTLIILFSNWESKKIWIKDKTDPNKVFVETIGLNSEENVIIKWTCETYCDTILIYNRNKSQNLNFKNSGNNIFLVYINDSLIFKEIQFKQIFWEGYKYKFVITKDIDSYLTVLEIEN